MPSARSRTLDDTYRSDNKSKHPSHISVSQASSRSSRNSIAILHRPFESIGRKPNADLNELQLPFQPDLQPKRKKAKPKCTPSAPQVATAEEQPIRPKTEEQRGPERRLSLTRKKTIVEPADRRFGLGGNEEFDYSILPQDARIYLTDLENKDHLEITYQIVKQNTKEDLLMCLESFTHDFIKQFVHSKRNIKFNAITKVQNYLLDQSRLKQSALFADKSRPSHRQQDTTDGISALVDLKFDLEDTSLRYIDLRSRRINEIEMLDIKDEVTQQMALGQRESGSDSEESAAAKCAHHHDMKAELADIDKIINDPSRLISTRQLIYKMKTQITKLQQDLQLSSQIQEKSSQRMESAEEDKRKAQQALNDARVMYTKDILNLQDQICQSREHPEDFEYVNASYLDLTDTFEESVKVAWEFQKQRLLENFNAVLHKLQKDLKKARDVNSKFQRLCDDGNQLIPIKRMTPDFVIGKLMIIEEDPLKIWESLENTYGAGYFREVLQKVMGVTDDWKNSLKNEFKEKILQTGVENERALQQLEKNLKREVTRLKGYADELERKAMACNEEYNEVFITKAREMEDSLKTQHQHGVYLATEQLEKRCKFLSEKVVQAELGGQSIRKAVQWFNLQHAMEKWKYASKLRQMAQKLKDINSRTFGEDKAKELNQELTDLSKNILTPKTISNQKYNSNVVLVDEMHKKYDQWQERARQVELENQKIRINANESMYKYNFSQVLITKQNAQLRELESKARNLEQDILKTEYQNQITQSSQGFKDAYMEFLEKEQSSFAMKLRKLSKNHPALAFFQKDPIQTLDEIRARVQVTFSQKAQRVYANVLGENRREKYSQTEMQGVHRYLEMQYIQKGELFAVNPQDKAIQCEPNCKSRAVGNHTDFEDQEIQTTFKQSDIESLVKAISLLIGDVNAFDKELSKLRRQSKTQKSEINFKDQFDVLQQILRSSLSEIQKNQEVKAAMIQANVQNIGSPDKVSKSANRLKTLRANAAKQGQEAGLRRNVTQAAKRKSQLSKGGTLRGTTGSDGQIHEVDEEVGSEDLSMNADDKCCSDLGESSRPSSGQVQQMDQGSCTCSDDGDAMMRKVLQQPGEPQNTRSRPDSKRQVLFSNNQDRSNSNKSSRSRKCCDDKSDHSPDGIMKENYSGDQPESSPLTTGHDMKHKHLHSGAFDLQEHSIKLRAPLQSGGHGHHHHSLEDQEANEKDSSRSRQNLQELSDILDYHLLKQQAANFMKKIQQSFVDSFTIEQQCQITQMFRNLLSQQPPPVIKIQPKNTLVSSHSSVLEKVLDQRYGLGKYSIDRQTQTDFDGIFIGRINGNMEVSKLKTSNEDLGAQNYLEQKNNYKALKSKDIFRSHRKLATRPSSAFQLLQNERRSDSQSFPQSSLLQMAHPNYQLNIKGFDSSIRTKSSIAVNSSENDEMMHRIGIYNEVVEEQDKHNYYSEKNKQVQREHNRKKLAELRRQIGCDSFNLLAAESKRIRESIFRQQKEMHSQNKEAKLNQMLLKSEGKQSGITINSKDKSQKQIAVSSKLNGTVLLKKNTRRLNENQPQLRPKSALQRRAAGGKRKNKSLSHVDNNMLQATVTANQSEAGGIFSGSTTAWRTSAHTSSIKNPKSNVKNSTQQLLARQIKMTHDEDQDDQQHQLHQESYKIDDIAKCGAGQDQYGNTISSPNARRLDSAPDEVLEGRASKLGGNQRASELTMWNQEVEWPSNAYFPAKRKNEIYRINASAKSSLQVEKSSGTSITQHKLRSSKQNTAHNQQQSRSSKQNSANELGSTHNLPDSAGLKSTVRLHESQTADARRGSAQDTAGLGGGLEVNFSFKR